MVSLFFLPYLLFERLYILLIKYNQQWLQSWSKRMYFPCNKGTLLLICCRAHLCIFPRQLSSQCVVSQLCLYNAYMLTINRSYCSCHLIGHNNLLFLPSPPKEESWPFICWTWKMNFCFQKEDAYTAEWWFPLIKHLSVFLDKTDGR